MTLISDENGGNGVTRCPKEKVSVNGIDIFLLEKSHKKARRSTI